MSLLLLVLVLLVVVALCGGIGFGYQRYGAAGYSPVVVILLAILVLWALGYLR